MTQGSRLHKLCPDKMSETSEAYTCVSIGHPIASLLSWKMEGKDRKCCNHATEPPGKETVTRCQSWGPGDTLRSRTQP